MRFFLLIVLVSFSQVFSQKNINKYEYLIIPKKFDFVKKVDEYQTSSLTKFLFNKHGFKAFLDTEKLPLELEQNNCKALKVTVINNSKLFVTKNVIQLKDCRGNVLFSSLEGKSRQKDYKKAYHEAIRQAFNSVKSLGYSYQPSEKKRIISDVNQVSSTDNNETNNKEEKEVHMSSLLVLFSNETKKGYILSDKNKKPIFHLLFTNLEELFMAHTFFLGTRRIIYVI